MSGNFPNVTPSDNRLMGLPIIGFPSASTPFLKWNDTLSAFEWVADPAGNAVETASNIGTGDGVFDSKIGSDLQFKTLLAGAGIIINDLGNELEIESTGGISLNELEFLQQKDAQGKLRNAVGGLASGTGEVVAITPANGVTTVIYRARVTFRGAAGQIRADLTVDGTIIDQIRQELITSGVTVPIDFITKGKQLVGNGAKKIAINVTANTGNVAIDGVIEAYDL